MEIVLSFLTLLGLVAGSGDTQRARAAELRVALDQAVMLHEAATQNRDPALQFTEPGSDVSQELEMDLVYMELDAGFLARTCVCSQERVFDMRLMIAYARLLRALGLPDARIIDRLAASAGEQEGRVRQFLDFAGVDGISHFICVDYLRAALQRGIPARELREYIDRAESPQERAGRVRVASVH